MWARTTAIYHDASLQHGVSGVRPKAPPTPARFATLPEMELRWRLAPLAALSLCLPLACGDDSTLGGSERGETAAEHGDAPDETGDSAHDTDAGHESETTDETTDDTGEEQCDPGNPELLEHEFLRPGDQRDGVTLTACGDHVWWISAAQGVRTRVTIAASKPVNVAISYPDAPSFIAPIDSATLYQPGALEFISPRSGEFAVLLRAQNPGDDPELELDYDIAVACTNQCQFETTRFPIVMVHGWTGFENIGPLSYYYKVREDLEALGYPIATAVLDPYNSVYIRGEQLVDFAAMTLQNRRARKVNLLGHSQGGIDSRYVAAEAGGGMGDRIGAVITLGTPHYGTPFTDIALGLLPGPTQEVLIFLFNFLGAAQEQQSDVEASLYTLSETFMQEEFNLLYTDDPRVKYWSWMGETCVAGIGCDDALDPLLWFSYETIAAVAGANDGLVPETSAAWGEYLGLIPADHIDEIGHISGLTSPSYDHLQFFRDNARMLRQHAY
jgi:pimeloyl-ACP methyl ester carboxylesterase